MSTSKIILAVLAGVAVGAAIGILLAPASGKETRENLSRKAGKIFDEAAGTVADLKGRVKEKVSSEHC